MTATVAVSEVNFEYLIQRLEEIRRNPVPANKESTVKCVTCKTTVSQLGLHIKAGALKGFAFAAVCEECADAYSRVFPDFIERLTRLGWPQVAPTPKPADAEELE